MTDEPNKSKRLLLVVGGLALLVGVAAAVVAYLLRDGGGTDPDKVYADLLDKSPVVTVQQKKIQAAIEKGAAFLKKQILAADIPLQDSRFGEEGKVGAIALAGLALLEAGYPPDDFAVQKALARVRQFGPKLTVIYPLGSVLFFLNRLSADGALSDSDRDLLRTLALRLIGGQQATGRWNYNNFVLTPDAEKALLAKLQDGTYKPMQSGDGSNSMTQFAILSLWGARKHGVPVRAPLLAAAVSFHNGQKRNGAWNYHLQPILHDANTCAGLLALAMEKTLREDKAYASQTGSDPPANPKVKELRARGFAHLATVIGRTKDSPAPYHDQYTGTLFKADAWGDYYFLWCLERVSVIYGLTHIGGQDWYAWGAEIVLANQRPEGSWVDRHGDVADTAFAMLFLTKANLAKDLTDKLRELLGAEDVQAGLPASEKKE